MSSSTRQSRHFLDLQFQPPSPLTPGSDTETLFDFVVDTADSPPEYSKAAAFVSPTETLAEYAAIESHDEASLFSRRLGYLQRIEKVLSTELSPFDLLTRSDSKQGPDGRNETKSFVAGALGVDAALDTRVDMQYSTSNSQSGAQFRPDGTQNGAFYDPSSADGYSAPLQSGLLNASTSSGATSPPQYGQGFASDPALAQTLGQIGQIKLDEDSPYPPTFDDGSDNASSPAFDRSNSGQQSDGFAPPAYSSIPNHSAGQQAMANAPKLSLGIPSVSVSDTSMDFTPVAPQIGSSADANMPSINVMAPSPSTPRAAGAQGFQDVLAQLLDRDQTIPIDGDAPSSQLDPSANWFSAAPTTSFKTEPSSYAAADSSSAPSPMDSASMQASLGQDAFRPQSAGARIIPHGYNAEPTQMMSTLAGQSQRTSPSHAAGQWSSQAKRQDSYDKIRQFLRLDVDMGFQSTGKTESPTLAMFRKRANSDIGPRSPVVAGNTEDAGAGAGTAFDWSFAVPSQPAIKAQANGADFDWSTFKGDPNLFAGAGLNMDPPQFATMDPSLLNNAQLSLDTSQGYAGNDALLASAQQQQLQQQQPQQQQLMMMPPVFQLNGQGNTMGGIDFSSQLAAAGPAPGEFNAQWRFPGDSAQNAPSSGATGATRLRRSNSARQSSPGGHRRLAQSEDLSRSRMYQGPDEQFLAQITAPNGGLAPPQSGRSVSSSSNNSAVSVHHHTMSGSARVHPYRSGHDRHYSFGSNASSSSTGSASPLPQMPGGFLLDAGGNLVSTDAFAAMGGMGMDSSNAVHSPSASSVASGTSSQLAPPVPVVTSQATQAASASRRKSEALFACPIPGCGSTFTRQYNLRGHLRSHADERPYKCDWPGCDKSFARSHDCKRHQNLHLNIKPHTCEQCGKTFARLDALNRHHKSDTGGCNSESQSNSTDAGSSQAGSRTGSDQGGQSWGEGTVEAGAGNAGSQQPGKAFGGHVL
uniref:C2H2-type domain-containing protein n=1 Tax=Kalmanozyma brasiliensis (strain GHG001) TaxID=1365824 RepID=V5GRE8_KALBG